MLDAITIWQLVGATLAGMILGGFYFGGLWWTVRQLPGARHPWQLYLTSFLIRMSAVLPICWALLSWGNWLLLVACFVGWWIARLVLIHYGALT